MCVCTRNPVLSVQGGEQRLGCSIPHMATWACLWSGSPGLENGFKPSGLCWLALWRRVGGTGSLGCPPSAAVEDPSVNRRYPGLVPVSSVSPGGGGSL